MKLLSVITAAVVAGASLVAGKAEDKAKKGEDPLEILNSDTCKDLRESILDDIEGVLAFEDKDIIDTTCSPFGRYKIEGRLLYLLSKEALEPGKGTRKLDFGFFGETPQEDSSYKFICPDALFDFFLAQDGVAELSDVAENEEECIEVVKEVLEELRSPADGGRFAVMAKRGVLLLGVGYWF